MKCSIQEEMSDEWRRTTTLTDFTDNRELYTISHSAGKNVVVPGPNNVPLPLVSPLELTACNDLTEQRYPRTILFVISFT